MNKDEGIGGSMGMIVLGAVAIGVVWTWLTGQVLHLLAIGVAVWAIGKAGRHISRR